MPVSLFFLFGLIGLMLSFLLFLMINSERGPYDIRWYDWSAFYILGPVLTVWFTLFAATKTEYATQVYDSVTCEGRDGFFDSRYQFHNLNGMFGRRFEPGTKIEPKWETPRYGLTWGQGYTYSVKDSDANGN